MRVARNAALESMKKLEGDRPPSNDLGIATFREQVPVVDPTNPDAKTYRIYQVNQHL
ncbi:hypothetical protein N9B98_04375 [bacterium]|nr:hypothetical protein [bacterium]